MSAEGPELETDGVPTDSEALDSVEPLGSPLAAAPELRADGVPTARDSGCFPVMRMRGGAEEARARASEALTAEALAAAFFEIPKSAAFLAILEVGSEPGFRPGDL